MTPLFKVALRNVRRNSKRSLLTFAAVLFALTVMVCIRALVNGMSDSIRESSILGQTGSLQIHRNGYLHSTNGSSLDLDIPADGMFLNRLRTVPGVRAVAPRIAFGAMVNANDTTNPALLTAIDPDGERQVCPRRFEGVTAGTTMDVNRKAVGLLTPELAGKLGIKLGARATLMASDRDGAFNALEFDYVGTYGEVGIATPDKKIGFISLALAQELLRMPARATELALSVNDGIDLEKAKSQLQAMVGSEFEVSTWHEVAPWVDEAIAANYKALDLCTFIFLFVALLGIVNTMFMSVLERSREIGTMMSIGVRRKQILGLFLIESATLGLFGGVCGSAIGATIVAVCARHGISFHLSKTAAPFHIRPWLDWQYLVTILLLAVVGAMTASFWPALRASRLRPVEALAKV